VESLLRDLEPHVVSASEKICDVFLRVSGQPCDKAAVAVLLRQVGSQAFTALSKAEERHQIILAGQEHRAENEIFRVLSKNVGPTKTAQRQLQTKITEEIHRYYQAIRILWALDTR